MLVAVFQTNVFSLLVLFSSARWPALFLSCVTYLKPSPFPSHVYACTNSGCSAARALSTRLDSTPPWCTLHAARCLNFLPALRSLGCRLDPCPHRVWCGVVWCRCILGTMSWPTAWRR